MNLKNPGQLEKAKLEDTIIELLYGKYIHLVLHGGTAIWRCYSGNRFSRDLDFYLDAKNITEKMKYYKEIAKFLQDYGFVIKEKGYSNSTNTMHFLVEIAETKMKININFNYKKGAPVEYLKVDGSKIIILSLNPLKLLNEKIEAYNDKFDNEGSFKHPEAHDLYDIWYLTTQIKKRDVSTIKKLKLLINKIEKHPPVDINSLGHLIISGVPPSFDFIIDKLKKWVNDNNQ